MITIRNHLCVSQEESQGPTGADRKDAGGHPRTGHQVLFAARRSAAEDPDIRSAAPEDPAVPVGQDDLPGAAAMEGSGPAFLAAVVARGPLPQGGDVVLGARWHVLPRHRQPVQDAAAVALPERGRWCVGHAAAVQLVARHKGDRPAEPHQDVPVDQGGVPGGHRMRLRLRDRRIRMTGSPTAAQYTERVLLYGHVQTATLLLSLLLLILLILLHLLLPLLSRVPTTLIIIIIINFTSRTTRCALLVLMYETHDLFFLDQLDVKSPVHTSAVRVPPADVRVHENDRSRERFARNVRNVLGTVPAANDRHAAVRVRFGRTCRPGCGRRRVRSFPVETTRWLLFSVALDKDGRTDDSCRLAGVDPTGPRGATFGRTRLSRRQQRLNGVQARRPRPAAARHRFCTARPAHVPRSHHSTTDTAAWCLLADEHGLLFFPVEMTNCVSSLRVRVQVHLTYAFTKM